MKMHLIAELTHLPKLRLNERGKQMQAVYRYMAFVDCHVPFHDSREPCLNLRHYSLACLQDACSILLLTPFVLLFIRSAPFRTDQ